MIVQNFRNMLHISLRFSVLSFNKLKYAFVHAYLDTLESSGIRKKAHHQDERQCNQELQWLPYK